MISVFSQFPILKLPYIALRETLRNLDPVELINLSLVSKKSRNAIKMSMSPNLFQLRACFTDIPDIVIWAHALPFANDVYDMATPFITDSSHQLGWTEYLSETLRCDVSTLQIYDSCCKEMVPFIMNWIRFRQQSINCIAFYSSTTTREELLLLFEGCNVEESLILDLTHTHYIEPIDTKIKVYSFYVYADTVATSWITVDLFLKCDCNIIVFDSSPFTEIDINRFLKAWINGNNFRVSHVRIRLNSLDREMMIDGLNIIGVITKDEVEIQSGIRRFDGKIGVISLKNQHFDPEGLDLFQFFAYDPEEVEVTDVV